MGAVGWTANSHMHPLRAADWLELVGGRFTPCVHRHGGPARFEWGWKHVGSA